MVNRTMKTVNRLSAVTPQVEAILKAVHFYRYVTALDIAHLLYSPTSLTHVRERLAALSGDADCVTHQYLYRVRLPTGAGNRPKVFTLGSRGRDYLANDLGMPVNWYFRPDKVRNMGYSHMLHNLILTRFLIAAQRWAARDPEFQLVQQRICYELAERPATVTITQEGQRRAVKVIPDAWVEFQRRSDGRRFPVLLEIDRGMHFQRKLKEQVASRIEYISCGAYKETFGTEAAQIAYVTTGTTQALAESRRTSLCAWTKEVLAEMRIANWASIFRFHALALDGMYETTFLRDAVWYAPDRTKPLPLFGS